MVWQKFTIDLGGSIAKLSTSSSRTKLQTPCQGDNEPSLWRQVLHASFPILVPAMYPPVQAFCKKKNKWPKEIFILNQPNRRQARMDLVSCMILADSHFSMCKCVINLAGHNFHNSRWDRNERGSNGDIRDVDF